jgi:putative phage-type endonuclease
MKKINVEQGSQEWLALRNNMVGASDAPVIMEMSPWTTPYQLWQRKMGLVEVAQTEVMKRGLDLEPIAREQFIESVGYNLSPTVALHDSIPYMMASFDGLSESGEVAVEIKCPGREDHEKAMDGIIPEKYIPQLMHQMEVAGIQSMFYFSFNERSSRILQIEKDENFIKKMIDKEKAFWDCMQNLEAPELVEKDYIRREDEEWAQLAKEWIEISKIEDRKEQIRKKLIALSGKSNSMGAGIKLSKIPRKGNVDYKVIPELIGIDLERYRKGTIETYRIGVY